MFMRAPTKTRDPGRLNNHALVSRPPATPYHSRVEQTVRRRRERRPIFFRVCDCCWSRFARNCDTMSVGLFSLSQALVRAYVGEPDLAKLAPGMTARIATDSYPGKRYEGWIGFISPTAEFTPKSVQTEELRTKLVYEVRVYVPNPKGELRLGMPATVVVDLTSGSNTAHGGSHGGSTAGKPGSEASGLERGKEPSS